MIKIASVPQSQRFLGNLLDFRADHLAWMLEVAKYGDIVKWHYGPFAVHQLNHPDPIHDVLVTRAQSFYKPRLDKAVFKDILGKGLLVSDGAFWRQQRKLVAPALHTTRVRSYAQLMVDKTERLRQAWRKRDEIDIWAEMSALTLSIVAKSLFDAEVSDVAYEVAQTAAVGQEIINHRFNRLFNPPQWIPTPENRRARKNSEKIDDVILPIIRERRASGEDRGDLLSMLLLAQDEDNGSGMTDTQVRDEAVTLFLAGHETTALALTWTWALISENPAVDHRLRAELNQVLGGRSPTVEDLADLPYTQAVIEESMRLYPPAWLFGRQAIEPVSTGELHLKKGGVVFISPYALHREERWYPQATAFEPERFLPEQRESIPKYAYIPFGAGPRVCIGNSFAMMEARLILATLAQHFRLRLQPHQDLYPVPLVTLRPRQSLMMTVKDSAAQLFSD